MKDYLRELFINEAKAVLQGRSCSNGGELELRINDEPVATIHELDSDETDELSE